MSDSTTTPADTGPSLRSALKSDDNGDKTPPASGSLKAVQIAEPDPEQEEELLHLRQFKAGPSKRLSGRPLSSHFGSVSSRSSVAESPSLRPQEEAPTSHSPHHHHNRQYISERLLAQVGDWLQHEKRKAAAKGRRVRRNKSKSPPGGQSRSHAGPSHLGRDRADSIDSQSSDISFDRLERILESSMSSLGLSSMPDFGSRSVRPPRRRKSGSRAMLQRTASSDTDYHDGDVIVPSCDVWLDNSKTLSYTGGSVSTEDVAGTSARAEKDREAWRIFKNEIVRTTHTLKLKGWRRIPLESGESINVERLSGALTNAVYVVTPPEEIPEGDSKKTPSRLLLRIYGPQVEHLIDRENELQVLQRLARKKIGPRLLGTFKNGRFEQYFNCITLTPKDLRDPETSKQIAKRMRELHDGMELLPNERESGPNVWRNWDSWVENVGRIVTFLDGQLEGNADKALRRGSVVDAWKANGYICGVPWKQFLDMLTRYRAYLNTFYKNRKALNERMTFSHNDTQYGNILRLRLDDEKSPLLQAANKHKQLVVIDFEYAAANVPGLEFANHFTEWTYNYHDPVYPYACNVEGYPTTEEQRRFLKAYVDHRPQFPHVRSTPKFGPADSGAAGASGSSANTPSLGPSASSSSIVDFMLDSRAPPGGWSAAERAREEQSDQQVRDLLDETRLWRPANSAQWVAWGIVQAKVPGLGASQSGGGDGGVVQEQEEEEPEEADEFDYLSYAQERALFFWGDCVLLGLVKKEDLPEQLRARLKLVDY